MLERWEAGRREKREREGEAEVGDQNLGSQRTGVRDRSERGEVLSLIA
jgi:hypothetical protein